MTEITRSEFITEIQSRGAIDLTKILTTKATDTWWKFADEIRFMNQDYFIIISNINLRNPPSRVEDTCFYDREYSTLVTIKRESALVAIDKLPFAKKTVTFKSVPAGASVTVSR
jgi:hypothetical protein